MDLGRIRKKLEEGLQGVGSFIGGLGKGIQQGVGQITQGIRNVVSQPQQPQIQQPQISTFRQPGIQPTVQPTFNFKSTFKAPGATQGPDLTKGPSLNIPSSPMAAIQTIKTEAPKAQLTKEQQVRNEFYKQTGKEPNVLQQTVLDLYNPQSTLGKSFIGQRFKGALEAQRQGDIVGTGKEIYSAAQDATRQFIAGMPAYGLAQTQAAIDRTMGRPTDVQANYEKNLDLLRTDKQVTNLAADIGESVAATASLFGNEKLASDIRQRAQDVRDFGGDINKQYAPESGRAKLGQQGRGVAQSIAVSALPGGPILTGAAAQGRVYDEMVKQGVDPQKAAIAATIYAPGEAILEKVGSRGATKLGGGFLRGGIRGFLREGGTEATQQLSENVIRNIFGDTSITSPVQGVPESFAVGGLVGGVSGGITGLAGPRNVQTQQQTQPTPVAQPTPQQVTATRLAPQQTQQQTQQPQQAVAEPGTAQEAAQLLQQQIEEAQGRYPNENIARKAERKVIDPFALAARIDRATAKVLGVKVLPKSQSLEAKLDIAIGNPDLRIQGRLKDFGVDKLLQKYPEGTPAGQEFNTYRIYKFAQELYNKRKINIIPGPNGTQVSPQAVNQVVSNYESKNPNAIADNKKLKQLFDDTLQRAEDAGVLEPGTAKYVSELYENYANIDRVLPEGLLTPEIGISPLATLSRQSIVQNIEGSNAPVDTSWEATINRLRAAERQISRNAAGNAYLQAVEAGSTVGKKSIGRITQTREQVLALRDLRNDLSELRDVTKQLTGQRGRVATQIRIAGMNLNQAQSKLINQVKTKLRNAVQDADAKSVINDLSAQDIIEIAGNMTQEGVWRNAQSFSSKSQKHANLVGELQGIRQDIATNKETGAEIRTAIANIQPDSTTGLQMVTVLSRGVPVKIETTPEVANLLQRMDEKKLDALTRFASYLTKPFRTAFTGWLNPIFSGISFTFFDAPMGYINSPNGWKTLVSPRAIQESLKSVSSNSKFQRALAESGAQLSTGSLTGSELKIDPKYIASRKNLFTKLKFAINPMNIKSTINSFDLIGGKMANITRTRIARASYDTAISKGMSEDAAIAEAVYAYNNIMPNYQRTTSVLRQIDAILPYTAASVAGTRAFGKAIRTSPVKTLGKVAIVSAPMVAAVAASFANADDAEEFYKDMINANKAYVLDSNMIIVTEGAYKDPKTNEWEGVIKIPVAPELRNINGIIWRQTYDNITGNNLATPKSYASALFNTMTGGIFQYVNNPAASTAIALLTNKDARGGEVVPEDLRYLPTEEQYTKNTTEISKQIANAIGQPPAKVQFVFDQFGLTGRLASGKSEIYEEVKDRFVGAKGVSTGAQYYKDLEADKKTIPGWNENDEDAYGALHPRKKDSRGEDIYDDEVNIYNPSARLSAYNRNPKVYELDKKQNERRKKEGKPGNPLFELENWQLKKVLEKEAMPPGSQDPELSKLFSQEWYANYRNEKTEFYKKLKELSTKEGWSFAQSDNPYPEASPQLQTAMDTYSKLPKKTGQRSAWIRDNQDMFNNMKNYWAAIDNWQNIQRGKRGLAATEGQAGIDAGFKEATGTTKKTYTRRFKQPYVQARAQKPGSLGRVPGIGPQLQLRPGRVVVKRTQA